MKASVIRKQGPAEVLCYEDVPTPAPGADDVLIDVQAITIEGGDIHARTIMPLPKSPHIIGYQAGGTVEAIGANVRQFSVGQRVVGFSFAGAYAEKFCVPEHYVFPIPEGLDIRTAACIPTTFATAEAALFEYGKLLQGETVLIRGGAGGVGLAAIQLAKAAGAWVIATARGQERAARLKDFGADRVVAYDEADYAAFVLQETQGKGADLIVDLAGGTPAAISKLISAARDRGRMTIVGAASGEPPAVGFWDIIMKRLTVYGVAAAAELHLGPAHDMIARHMRAAADGAVKMPIDKAFPLARAAEAHRYVETAHPFGRVLLIP